MSDIPLQLLKLGPCGACHKYHTGPCQPFGSVDERNFDNFDLSQNSINEFVVFSAIYELRLIVDQINNEQIADTAKHISMVADKLEQLRVCK